MPDLVSVAPAQCRLEFVSSTSIKLSRHNGKYIPLKIGGVWAAKEIPSSEPALANTGLTAATLYHIYAYDNAGTLTLEASTTGPVIDSDVHLNVKAGDASRLLVGMVYMGAGTPGLFVDSTIRRFVASYFNRKRRPLTNHFTADRTTNSGTFTELNTEIRIEAVVWGDEAVEIIGTGPAANGTAGKNTTTGLSEDGTVVCATAMNTGINGASSSHVVAAMRDVAVGYHYWTLAGRTTDSSTGTWYGASDDVSGGPNNTGGRYKLHGVVVI
jgi:hypothetical protein